MRSVQVVLRSRSDVKAEAGVCAGRQDQTQPMSRPLRLIVT
jgi:hypothetical protein